MRATHRLTTKQCREAPPKAKTYHLLDGGGLYLRVLPSGLKTWYHRTKVEGVDHWRNIGHFPTVSLLAARADVESPHQRTTTTTPTLQAAIDAYIAHQETQIRRAGALQRILEVDIARPIGTLRPITSITRNNVVTALKAVVARGAPVAANRGLAAAKGFFSYCVDQGWLDESPIAAVRARAVGGRERSRKRTLTYDEIVDGFVTIESSRLQPGTRAALYLALLTGLRMSEVLSLHRMYVTGAVWTIPAHIMKADVEHRVPLSRPAQRLVERLCCSGEKPFTFTHDTVSRAVRRLGFDWTPHDFRRTLATRLSDEGVAPHIIEKLLTHKMTGVMAVYNRADYWPERVQALQLWGKIVVRLRKKARVLRAKEESTQISGAGALPVAPPSCAGRG